MNSKRFFISVVVGFLYFCRAVFFAAFFFLWSFGVFAACTLMARRTRSIMLTRFMVELRTTPQSKLAKGRSYQVLYRLGLQGGVR